MVRIGLLSDTHGWLDPRVLDFFEGRDEAWHCGDIGDLAVTDALAGRFTLRAVHGNVDDGVTRRVFPAFQRFTIEEVSVLMTHIGGYPGNYDRRVAGILLAEKPRLFACGHSHIAKVQYDHQLGCLHVNPGAAGRSGFHAVRTVVRFEIDAGEIRNMELLELKK
jgi:putative phosphoesterase